MRSWVKIIELPHQFLHNSTMMFLDFFRCDRNSMSVIAVLACLGLVIGYVPHSHADNSESRPNIILIMADDLGFRELGSYGQKWIKTPHLDALAEEGMRFINHYSSAPVCAPARCSLMTGRHGGQAFVRNNYEIGDWDSFRGQLPLPNGTATIASLLKESGYQTGAFGKWGMGEPGSSGDPLNTGFDRFYGYNCQRHAHNYYPRFLIDNDKKVPIPGNDRGLTGSHYAPQLIADQLLNFIEMAHESGEAPFFVYYPTVIPHLALQVPEKELEQYNGLWEETPYTGKSYLPHPKPKAAYAGMISFMDHQVGRIIDKLEHLGQLDNTLILFTSDNGTTYLKGQVDFDFFQSTGNLRGLKGEVYEGGIRVPLIASWPGKIKSGTVSHHLCTHYDIMETLFEAAKVDDSIIPPNNGISFFPALVNGGAQEKSHEILVWDFAGYGGQLAARMGDWKFVQRNVKRNSDAPMELYNLKSDIGESKNLAEERPDILQDIYWKLMASRRIPEIPRFRFGKYIHRD